MTDPVSGKERRGKPQLRAIFVQAYEVLAPFFDPVNSWGGRPHEHLAYRALHEQFPGLSNQDVFTLVAAARRVFDAGSRPAP